MLPRSLYEALPYIYLVVGVLSGWMIQSSLIFIASLLLIAAGLISLYMRWRYRVDCVEAPADSGSADRTMPQARNAMSAADKRSGDDRRKRQTSRFPLTDYAGRLIAQERRRRERRNLDHQSLA